jgi:hypothetical protein
MVGSVMGGRGGGSSSGAGPAVVESGRTSSDDADAKSLFGTDGFRVLEPWGSWTQSKEDIELKFTVDAAITSKQVQVEFAIMSVKVSVSGQVMLEGKPFDAIRVDDCTYTLESTTEGRELCVTLAKAQEGRTWSWAVL